MIWSISGYKQFNKCRRQWYYKNIVADAKVKKDPYRREITILSKLQTIDGWRGAIVDNVISRLLVNAINRKLPIDKDYFLNEADNMFEKQLEYASFLKYRNSGSKLAQDEHFAALLQLDRDEEIPDEEINRVRKDIHDAINNLLDDSTFIDYLRTASYVISQRSLTYSYDRFTVRAIPDFVVFFDNAPPHIIDWKVHTFGNNNYEEQLISYAAALFKVAQSAPHRDFPPNLADYSIRDYKLSEYQLLHKDRIKRDYEVTSDQLEELSDKMSASVIQMYMAGAHKKYAELKPENFETTRYVENCNSCSFKKYCKQHDYEIRDQYLQN